ncbi:MAG: hypothetical protein AAF726_21530 [Planctomycetota bacterium]
MGLSSTFVSDRGVDAVTEAMTRLMLSAGFVPSRDGPTPSEHAMLRNGRPGSSDVLVVLVRPAVEGWTAVEIWPRETLCEVRDGAPRLLDLAEDLDRPCFCVIDFDEPSGTLLVEAAPGARFRIRGYLVSGDDPLDCYGIRIPEEDAADVSLAYSPNLAELNALLAGDQPDESLRAFMRIGWLDEERVFDGESPEGCTLLIGRREDAGVAEPLALDVERESSLEGERLILRKGSGEAWLETHRLESPTPEAGRSFVGALGEWFGTALPDARWTEPQYALWVSRVELDANQWRLRLGAFYLGELRLTVDGSRGTLEETSTGQRDGLLQGIARSLLVPEGFVRLHHPPSFLGSACRLFDGRFVGLGWMGEGSEVWC